MRGRLSLFYALPFATGLPHDAPMFSASVWPDVHPEATLASADDLAAVLARPVSAVGCGRIRLGQLDCRLSGLAVSISTFQVSEGRGVLIALGAVHQDGPDDPGAVDALWDHLRGAAGTPNTPRVPLDGLGDGAFLALHGLTVQVAWQKGRRLATVSVTRLEDDPCWSVWAACAIATAAHGYAGAHRLLGAGPEVAPTA